MSGRVEGKAGPESLSGKVSRYRMYDPDSGFAILVLDTEAHGKVVVRGYVSRKYSRGTGLVCHGGWHRHETYGLQWNAEGIEPAPPERMHGSEVVSWLIQLPGVGERLAKRIYRHFGEEAPRILTEDPERIREVKGVGNGVKYLKILDGLAENADRREVFAFLREHGFGLARAERIWRAYGRRAVQLLSSDPYRLIHDIPGIAFTLADQMASSLGIRGDHRTRMHAVIMEVLRQAAKGGDCALRKERLIHEARKLAGVDDAPLLAALERALERGELVSWSRVAGAARETLVQHPVMQRAEESVLRDVTRLAGGGADCVAGKEEIRGVLERSLGFEPHPRQVEAIHSALGNRLSIITGGPGVGKTTIVRGLLELGRVTRGRMFRRDARIALAAPTGKAADRLGESVGNGYTGCTLHRLLEFRPGTGFARNRRNPLEADLVIVDESSMIDLFLMRSLLAAIPDHARLVLVGDADQLPPVGPGAVFRDLIDSETIPVSRLTEVFRQGAHSAIKLAAHDVNSGQIPDPSRYDGGDFVLRKLNRNTSESVQAFRETLDEVIREVREQGGDPVEDIQILSPMTRGPLGTIHLNDLVRRALNPEPEGREIRLPNGFTLREGDKVIQTKNNYDLDVFNGNIGRIVRTGHGEHPLLVRFGNREISYKRSQIDQLAPAWAITIHKSQGSQFPRVIIPLSISAGHYNMLNRALVYTGMTRSMEKLYLLAEGRALRQAVSTKSNIAREGTLSDRLGQLRQESATPDPETGARALPQGW